MVLDGIPLPRDLTGHWVFLGFVNSSLHALRYLVILTAVQTYEKRFSSILRRVVKEVSDRCMTHDLDGYVRCLLFMFKWKISGKGWVLPY